MNDLFERWVEAKEYERVAQIKRKEIEDQLAEVLKIDAAQDKSQTLREGDFVIKVTTRLNRKVDSDLLQDLAAKAGVSEHLSVLFRWKPEINTTAWKAAAENITKPLLGAITTTPGRPSFNITKEEK